MAAQGTAGTATEPPPVPPPVSPGPPAVSPPVSPFVPPLECGGDDAQAMGREPLPLLRQILAACAFPELLESPALPEAARDRARRILREMDAGNIGGYNHEHRSHGVPTKISRFLEFRDGIPCDPKNIVLCSGTSTVIPFLLSLFVSPSRSLPPGVLVPVPGPARCSELSVLAGAVPVPVPLDESRGWAWNVPELRRRIRESRSRCEPRVLWVLNPGDPTGHVLSQAQMQELLEVAFEESLLLLADEVHQDLCFSSEFPFVPFRRALARLGPPVATELQLGSLWSLSHSAAAESGFRAGFLELLNVDPALLAPFQLAQSLPRPCVPGRILLELILEPPDERDPLSRELEKHRQDLRSLLASNARRVLQVLGRAPGIRCHPPAAGPRVFPKFEIPPRARSQARALSLPPDRFFCRRLRERAGLGLSPGSDCGMGGDSGDVGLSLLLPPPVLERALELLRRCHAEFLREFS
ncbi:alanine aminotransferase 1-like isoform X2 [Catharus ustulatus]|uniref:alanine aminotransferase 1-like isoform X2 n=1 Tax=Catharus ustulatus TaxID=91951 RepID=UPI00140DB017|nr:alanine aminotransferase 1-like isoform X2 [Catharus ustulatus]